MNPETNNRINPLTKLRGLPKTVSDSTENRESGLDRTDELNYNESCPAIAPLPPSADLSLWPDTSFLLVSEIAPEHVSDFNILFVRSDVDSLGLSPTEFRVYAHLCRRAGKREAFPSITTVAYWCCIHPDTAAKAIKTLIGHGMLARRPRPGTSSLYAITPASEWKIEPLEPPTRFNQVPESKGYHPPETKGYHPPEDKGYEVTPSEVTPKKGIHICANEPSGSDLKASDPELPPMSAPPPSKRLTRPTADEARAYAVEKDMPADEGDAFVDYWTGRGWTMGRGVPMKDWKAAMRTWQRNWKQRNTPPPWKRKQQLEEQIATHPANYDWIGYRPENVTPELMRDLKQKQEELKGLK